MAANLADPGTELLGRHEAATLRALSRLDGGKSGRGIAALANATSHMGIQRALKKLEEVGLVESRPVGNAIEYTLNRDHVLWPGIALILNARSQFFEGLGRWAESHLPDGTTLFVFGSVARGDARRQSDVDLGVIFIPGTASEQRESVSDALAETIQRMTGNPVHVFSIDDDDLRRMAAASDPLLDSWRDDAIDVSGEAIRIRVKGAGK